MIVLLLALKLKFPENINLLRGSHEDLRVNKVFGFADECIQKLNENINDPKSVFNLINNVFEYLPLAAIVEDEMFCVHSGIGN